MTARCAIAPQLRARLRAATQHDHSVLDSLLGRLDLADRREYGRFLRIQLSARMGVERWLHQHGPREWLPPSQVALLRRDLEWLGELPSEEHSPRFAPPPPDRQAWIGAAWVLAGSSLGNKMMLRDLASRAPASWPTAFLSDQAMLRYFVALRPLLENPLPDPAAERGARAVFAHFLAEAEDKLLAIAE